ncbi:MAG TPA: hypothetical protein VNT23_02410 [Gaiellaceae bacterium]|nr:hypothetical protein [Gaiellaceae bacterium]
MDDREAGSYSTPPEAAPDPAERREARAGFPGGFAAIGITVFLVFVIFMVLKAVL